MEQNRIVIYQEPMSLYYRVYMEELVPESNLYTVTESKMVHENQLEKTIADSFRGKPFYER